MEQSKSPVVSLIPMALIDRPVDPDRISIDPDSLKELIASIRQSGLKQPILLNIKGERFEIVAGERRYLACESLGMVKIPAFTEVMSEPEVAILRAIENLQRENLTIIEEAHVYRRLHDNLGMSWDDIGKKSGKSPGLVKRRYDLLKMPEQLINAMHKGQIGYAVAEELKRLGDLGKIDYFLSFAIDHGATKEVVRKWVDEEMAQKRQEAAAGGGGGGGYVMPEARPVFLTCDLCHGPVDVMKLLNLRICPDCGKIIRENMQS